MLRRWQSPVALVVVLFLTNWAYDAIQSRSATITSERDAEGRLVAIAEYAKGRVLSVVRTIPEGENEVDILEIELLGGTFKGQRALFRNYLHPRGFPLLNVNAKVGDIVLCRVAGEIGASGAALSVRNLIQDYNRDGFIVALFGILLAVVVIVGRATGIRSALTILINGFILYYILLPMLHTGYNPVWSVVMTCSLVSLQSRLIVAGFGRKTYAAILGTIGGVVFAGVIVMLTQSQMHFTGIEKADAVDIIESQSAAYLDFAGLLVAGMLIGLLGIANDAAIEVASAMEEVNEANPNLSIPRLVQSGMNVGTDILGTMANTVVFVYFGMRLLVILAVLGTDIIPVTAAEVFSIGVIASEIVRVLAGTIGLVITIPLTAFFSGLFHLYTRRRHASP